MKLWSMQFFDQNSRYQSIRVAAPTKSWAMLLLQQDIDNVQEPLCHFIGEARVDIGIIEKVIRGGEIEVQ